MLQPLDHGFFGPLKKIYAAETDKWIHNHPGLAISQTDICFIFREAYERVANLEKAKNAFRATGIHPYSPDVFTEENFLPSQVTDQSVNGLEQGNVEENSVASTSGNGDLREEKFSVSLCSKHTYSDHS